MTIKEEMGPKDIEPVGVNIILEKKRGKPKGSKNKTKFDEERNLDKKFKDLETENKKQRKCLKEKDERLTRIEKRWSTVKSIFGVVGYLTLISLVFILGAIAYLSYHTGFSIGMYIVGLIFFIWIISTALVYLLVGVIDGFDLDDFLFSGFISIIITIIICFIIFLYEAGSLDHLLLGG